MKLLQLLLLTVLLPFSNGNRPWCGPTCGCRSVENDYGDTEFTCSKSTSPSLRIIENAGHFMVTCEVYKEERNWTSSIESLQLRLNRITSLELRDCPTPSSFSVVFKALGVTKLDFLTLERQPQSPPIILDATTLPRDDSILRALQSLTLRNSNFIVDSLKHLIDLQELEAYGITLVGQRHSISQLPPTLKTLKLHEVSNLVLGRDSFFGLSHLRTLSLTSDLIETLPKDIFMLLKRLVIVKLSHNPLSKFPPDLFAHNHALEEVMWYGDACSRTPCRRTFTKELFGNCSSLRSFYYSSGSSSPGMKLYFEDGLFESCKNLKTLHLTAAGLTSSDLARLQLSQSLEKVILYKNNITVLRPGLLPISGAVSLRGNPLNCSHCETLSAYMSLMNNLDPNMKWCSGTPQSAWASHNCSRILGFSTNEEQLFILYVSLGILMALALLSFLLVALILMSESLRARLYNHRFWSLFFKSEYNEEEGSIKYDAFISYAEEDSEYVHKVILPGLEEGRRPNGLERVYTCCDHHRDWPVGEEILSNIMESINASSRTIIVLSRHFLSSSWAQIEFDEAYIKRRVILILRGSHSGILEGLNSFPTIRNYIDTFTYLKEEDPLFWEKLTYLLPHRKMNSNGE